LCIFQKVKNFFQNLRFFTIREKPAPNLPPKYLFYFIFFYLFLLAQMIKLNGK